MISGKPVLPLWYHDRAAYDLTKLFPGDGDMAWINEILAATVVEEPDQCLPSSADLLPLIDNAIAAMRRGGAHLREGEPWPCRVCGLGQYRQVFEEARVLALPDPNALRAMTGFGQAYDVSAGSARTVKAYACDHCGNFQLFWHADGQRMRGWRPAKPKG
jgi:hypothetical protein